jgi:signal transduction histidine kinase
VINTAAFEKIIGVPPVVLWSVIGLVLAISIIRALEVFKVEMEHRIERMEQQQILVAERERIGRELHDSTIQTAYTAGLLVDSARKLADPDSQFASRLDKAVEALNEVIRDLRRNLGELKTQPTTEPLPEALLHLAEDPRFHSLVNVHIDLQLDALPPISPTRKDHIVAIANEALVNVIRHAKARQVFISAHQEDGHITLNISDDGTGFIDRNPGGYGMRNMQDRARLLGGRLHIASEKGKGTRITLDVPLSEE